MAMSSSVVLRSMDQQALRPSAVVRRFHIVSAMGQQLPHVNAQQLPAEQRLPFPTRSVGSTERQQVTHGSSGARTALVLSSTTSAAAAATEASLPTAFARALVGATLALSTIYALLSSPAAGIAGSAFLPGASPAAKPGSSDSDALPGTAASASSTTSIDTLSISTLPILRTPDQFDAFVIASNRAGYLAIVLFHAPWCSASQRMESELQRLSHLFTGRRVVFARVDCSITQGVRPGQPLGAPPSPGFRLWQRCDLTQLHRIHKTPTMRMYYNNACIDEIIGCRPVDFRQAASDLTFKYNL